jgi:hypothetical protein
VEKVYEGRRTMDGLRVTANGDPLPEYYEVKRFTPYGFEWTYEGPEPRQLALAILADYLNDPQLALELSESFMKRVVANLDNDWTLTGDEIDVQLRELKAKSHAV